MGYPPAIVGDYLWCVSPVGLECRPVTPEVTGSSPVRTAIRKHTANSDFRLKVFTSNKDQQFESANSIASCDIQLYLN